MRHTLVNQLVVAMTIVLVGAALVFAAIQG